jgi:CheY-like chemotaxis protein
MQSSSGPGAFPPADAEHESSDRRTAVDGASPPTDSLRGRTILVADADADTRELYRLCLQSTGAKVCDAFDGRDALAKTYSERPDAIVMDVQLPFIDGLELCRLLRIDAMTSRLPLVLVAAHPVTAAGPDSWRAGADAVFVKPFPPDSLPAELARLLRADRHAEVPAARGDGKARPATPLRDRRRRHVHDQQPFVPPPTLRCPICDRRLQHERSHTGGLGAHGAEQWDYFSCVQCGAFQYRHRTRKLRRVG